MHRLGEFIAAALILLFPVYMPWLFIWARGH